MIAIAILLWLLEGINVDCVFEMLNGLTYLGMLGKWRVTMGTTNDQGKVGIKNIGSDNRRHSHVCL